LYYEHGVKTLSIKVTEALERKLTAAVKHRRTQKSVLVREALERYLNDDASPRSGSVLHVAGELAGCVTDAPRDLSSNPRHMSGFGK
jgi:metal-responsive CopG/Arc/MetJ family transcriptional regulator